MARELKQSTVKTVKVGPFTTSTGTVITDLAILQAEVRLSKAGGNMAQKNSASAAVHDELGIYDLALNATDTDTLGELRIDFNKAASAALPVWEIFDIVTANYYDTKHSTDKFEVDLQAAATGILSAGVFGAAAISSGVFAADALTAGVIATAAITADAFAADALTAGTFATGAFTADAFAADALAAATIATGAFTADAFAAAALSSGVFAADALTAGVFATASITADAMAAQALSSGVFAANALTAGIFAGSCFAISNFDATYRMYVAEGIPKNAAYDLHVLMVGSSDHRTGLTGMSTLTMTRTMGSAGSWAAGSAALSEIGNGFYLAELAATDTNGDVITYRFYATADATDDTFIAIRTSA